MIAQNEVNAQGELAYKIDNRTASYDKPRRTFVQIK